MLRLRSQLIACLAMTIVIGCLLRGVAFAHRFGGPNDPCERKIGTSLIHITLYQPQFNPDAEYCDQIPRAGNTVLVVDVLGDDLRHEALGVQVIAVRDSGPDKVVLSIPPQIYRRGVADAQVMLDDSGAYITRISIGEGSAQQLLAFKVRVSEWYRPFIVPTLLVLGVLALIAISILRYYYLTSTNAELTLEVLDGKGRPTLTLLPRPEKRASGSKLGAIVIAIGIAGVTSMTSCHSTAPAPTASLPDVQVVDDHGNPVSLGSLKGKVVLLDFIHVGCPGICTDLVNKFGQIADSLGPELGSKVVLLSVTNDPVHDNPAELLKLAKSSQADMKGWLFVTGKQEEIYKVLLAFGITNPRLPDGSPNHISRVFLLDADGRQKHEFQGMVMKSGDVVAQIKDELEHAGSS
jgi:cytochrome oxidase Cu insertion factor (SCO1/SenC/PrrC family)